MSVYKIKNDYEWRVFMDEEEFLRFYPKPQYGKYLPQPYPLPEQFPCLVKEIITVCNSRGLDDVIICCEYDFELMVD